MRTRIPFLLVVLAAPAVAQDAPVERAFAVRIDGKLVGHQTETEKATTFEGHAAIEFASKGTLRLELLGAAMDQVTDQKWILDAATGAVLRLDAHLQMGNTRTECAGALGPKGFELAGKEPLDPERTAISPKYGWLLQRGPKAIGDEVEIDWLVPETGGVQRTKVQLVEPAERELQVSGRATKVRVYRLVAAKVGLDVVVFVDAATGVGLRYEAPAQKMTVELADPAVIQRLSSFDVTDSILLRAHIDVDDPLQLTFLRARAVIKAGGDVTAESLTVGGQRFEGKVEGGTVDGTFTIRALHSDGRGALAFPVPAGAFSLGEMGASLRPETGIESDDPTIVEKARALAAGQPDCYRVVERMAVWVHDHIAYAIPGGGTAKATLQQLQGECAGHSRLLAALLRSVGIPARLVVGGTFTSLYGGCFCQHVWNEVWVGERIGWMPVDSTAGEIGFVDAGHIRLGPGAVGFRPTSIEVLEHEPKAAPAAARREDAWPFTAGDVLQFAYSIGGQPIGQEFVTYEGRGDGGHTFVNRLRLDLGTMISEMGRTTVADDGRLRSFHLDRRTEAAETAVDVQMNDGVAVVETTQPAGTHTTTVDAQAAAFVVHNNCMAHWCIALCRLGPFDNGTEAKVQVLQDEAGAVLPMVCKGRGPAEVEVNGRKVKAQALTVEFAGTTMELHVDDRGRLLRLHLPQGDVTVERTSP